MTKRTRDDDLPTPKRRKVEIDFSDEIAVLVGEEEKRMVAHKNLLCRTSIFFQTACNGHWNESKEKTVRLKEADPKYFAAYAKWLYTGDLDAVHDDSACTSGFHPACEHTDNLLIKGYFLGDFLGDEEYCNASIDMIQYLAVKYNCSPSLGFVRDHWSCLPQQSGLRRLLVDQLVASVHEEDLRQLADSIPRELFLELAVALVNVRYTKKHNRPEHRPKDYYHDKTKESRPQTPEAGSGDEAEAEAWSEDGARSEDEAWSETEALSE